MLTKFIKRVYKRLGSTCNGNRRFFSPHTRLGFWWAIHPFQTEGKTKIPRQQYRVVRSDHEVTDVRLTATSPNLTPIQNVIFSLFSSDDDATSHCGLDAPSVSIPVEEGSDWKLVCQALSDLKGRFQFPVVQPGHYKILPLYQGENIRFDITPATFEFDVEDSRLILTQKFEVYHHRFYSSCVSSNEIITLY
jgi:hypothetical protein